VEEPLTDRLEQPVASGVAQGLVDHLEPVEVEEQHGHARRCCRVPSGQRVGDPVGEQLAIG
jgi:hypothetical protein